MFGRRHRRSRSNTKDQGEGAALTTIIGRRIGFRRVVMVMTDVNVEVDKPCTRLAVAVPIEGRVGAESQRDQGRQGHQQRTEPSYPTLDALTQPFQHELRLYSLLPDVRQPLTSPIEPLRISP
jgi:hypothetical protein